MLAREPGYDGSEVHFRTRPIPGTRIVQVQAIRSQRGTFTWRYGHAKPGSEDDALYLAGCEIGRAWERAGLDGPGTVDWGKVGVASWRGMPPPRIVALDILRNIRAVIGHDVVDRLAHYVAQGRTTGDIAKLWGFTDREIVGVLRSDLKAAARYYGKIDGRK